MYDPTSGKFHFLKFINGEELGDYTFFTLNFIPTFIELESNRDIVTGNDDFFLKNLKLASMPSVVMKKSIRIFGARVLRSGRRFFPAHIQQDNHNKVSAVTEPQGWIHLLQQNSDGGRDLDFDVAKPEIPDSTLEVITPMPSRSDYKPSFQGDRRTINGDRFVLIYHRKRKRSDLNDAMFGKRYFRKRCRTARNTESSSFSLIIESENRDRNGWLSSFLCSIFEYMLKNDDMKVSTLSSLLLSNPISSVFSSQGIDFSWVPSWVTRAGVCKIHGSKSFTPLFTLEFSALPSCFMYLHSGLLLNRSLTMVDAPNLTLVEVNSVPPELTVELPVLPAKKFNRNKRKRRAYVKPEKPEKPVNTRPRRSIPKPKDMKLVWEYNNPIRCRANIIFFEPDDYLKVNDVVIMLEMSTLRKWSITVSKNRLLQFNFHPLKTMESCSIIHDTHAVRWRDNRYSWKFEFVNNQQWLRFQELYRVCSDRNLPTDAPVKVPVFREIENYDEDYEKNVGVVPFVRTESYIRVRDDELARVLKKRTIYEMDSDDENWLGKYNGDVSKDDFELIIDASQLNLASYPKDVDANVYVDLENKDFVKAVFDYWKSKEKDDSPLCRIYKSYEHGKDKLRMKRVIRKKRTTAERKRRQPETGKLFWKYIGKDPLKLDEEKKVLQKYEVGKDRATILVESAIEKRKVAQMLMKNADLATAKALEAIRIAEEAKFSESRTNKL